MIIMSSPLLRLCLLLIFVIFLNGIRSQTNNCPANLNNNPSIPCFLLGPTCYCFSTNVIRDWATASIICTNGNMTVASVETKEENDLLVDQIKALNPGTTIKAKRYWLSGKCEPLKPNLPHSEYFWQWKSTGQAFCNYVNFFSTEGTCSTTQNCVYFARDVQNSNWLWSQYPCNTAWNFICEQQASESNACDDDVATTTESPSSSDNTSSSADVSITLSTLETINTTVATQSTTTTTGSSSQLILNKLLVVIVTATGLLTYCF